MSERMTDERLAEIEERFSRLTGPDADYPQHIVDTRLMIRALKAEREAVERLRSKLNTQEIAEGRAADLEYEPTEAEARLNRLLERLGALPIYSASLRKAIAEARGDSNGQSAGQTNSK